MAREVDRRETPWYGLFELPSPSFQYDFHNSFYQSMFNAHKFNQRTDRDQLGCPRDRSWCYFQVASKSLFRKMS